MKLYITFARNGRTNIKVPDKVKQTTVGDGSCGAGVGNIFTVKPV